MTFLTDTLTVTLDGTNITDDVIAITRDNNICSGIGKVSLRVYGGGSISPTTWEPIVVKENGTTKGTYYVSDFAKDAKSGELIINGQDNSKRLVDWFIAEEVLTGGITYARTWIEYFLNQAGVSFSFTTVEQGGIVAPDTTFGFSSAFDTIQSLLQMSGWYMYFDGTGTAIIGKLDVELEDPQANISESEIINIYTQKSDKMLRNRAVVWGEADQANSTWVFADVSTDTPWNYDSADKRTVVLANPYIQTFYTAYELANQLLAEFARLNYEKTVVAAGYYNIAIGDVVMINSRIFTGLGLVTGLLVETSREGIVTTIEIDRRCPRLFGYFSYDNNYVYAGTWGAGVWRKLIESSTWADFSAGLGVAEDTLRIKDLFVRNGLFVCVSDDGYAYYKNSIYSNWTKFLHGTLKDSNLNEYVETTVRAESCSINETGEIIVSYNYDDGVDQRAWVVFIGSGGIYLKAEQVILSGEEGLNVFDLEAWTPEVNIISTTGTSTAGFVNPGTEERNIQLSYGGITRAGFSADSRDSTAMDNSGTYLGLQSSYVTAFASGTDVGSFIVDENRTVWVLGSSGLGSADLDTASTGSHGFTTPTIFPTSSTLSNWFLYRQADDNIYFSCYYIDLSGSAALKVQTYRYNGTTTLVDLGNTTLTAYSGGANYWSFAAYDKFAYVHYKDSSGNARLGSVNMSTGTFTSVAYASTSVPTGSGLGFDRFLGVLPTGQVYAGYLRRWASGGDEALYLELATGSAGGVQDGGTLTIIDVTSDSIAGLYHIQGAVNHPNPIGTGVGGSYIWVQTAIRYNGTEQAFRYRIALPSLGIIEDSSSVYTLAAGFYDPTGEFTWVRHAGGGGTINSDFQVVDNLSGSPYYVGRIREFDGSGNYYYRFINMVTGILTGSRLESKVSELSSLGIEDVEWLGIADQNEDNLLATAARSKGGNRNVFFGISPLGGDIAMEVRLGQGADINFAAPFAEFLSTKTVSNARFYKFTPTRNSSGASYEIVTHVSTTAETSASDNAVVPSEAVLGEIYSPPKACKVEISKYSPTVIYSPPPSGKFYYDLTSDEKDSFLAVSFTLESGAFTEINTGGNTVFDARVFDVPVNEQFYVEDGPLTGIQPERYIMLATGEELQVVETSLDGSLGSVYQLLTYDTLSTENTITLSGIYNPLFNHIESTNFILYPWLFVSLSGVIPADAFWQRGDIQTSFLRYSTAVPSGADITTIRTDDFI